MMLLFIPDAIRERHAAAVNDPAFLSTGALSYLVGHSLVDIRPLRSGRRITLYDGGELVDVTAEFWDSVRAAYRRQYGNYAWARIHDGRAIILERADDDADVEDFRLLMEQERGDGFLAARSNGRWMPAEWSNGNAHYARP